MKLIFIILTLSVISYTHAQQQKPMIQEKTSGQCSNLAGGSTITSIAECEQVGLGWGDVVVGTVTVYDYPPGCFLRDNNYLYYNTDTTSTASCSSNAKCACSITCSPGTYQDEDSQTTCKSCTAGLYQNVAGKSQCKQCPDGEYSSLGAPNCATNCPESTYALGIAACVTSCPAGMYASDEAMACEACTEGEYSSLGASSCDYTSTSCPANMYATGKAACEACTDGEYSSLGASSCKTCPGVLNDDRTACGQYEMYPQLMSGHCSGLQGGSAITSSAECNKAAVVLDWFETDDRLRNPTVWRRWDNTDTSYSDAPPGCYQMPSGTLMLNTLTTSTIQCSSDSKCACSVLCQPGTYQDTDGQSTCKSCTSGSYQSEKGQAECQDWSTCKAGHKQTSSPSDIADRVCEACPAGTYQDDQTCKACQTDKYSPLGAVSCDYTCPAGTSATGTSACTKCDHGKSSVKGGECYLLAMSTNLGKILVNATRQQLTDTYNSKYGC
tara:strand:- start:365 stop:1855 length:1491 start_codon:yes stop_codon:yes gene_type:complete